MEVDVKAKASVMVGESIMVGESVMVGDKRRPSNRGDQTLRILALAGKAVTYCIHERVLSLNGS